jgi:hypothetical protein
MEVPGTGALSKARGADVTSVSCASAGNCAVVGDYAGREFVASEQHGTWRRAIEIPGTSELDTAGFSRVTSVSCALAGNCAAGGFYTDSSGITHAFVASERNGTWHAAIELPGTSAVYRGGTADGLSSVSCGSAGNCAAVGNYTTDSLGDQAQAYVANERNGIWHAAIELPGTGALNMGDDASANSVSCASADNCAAVGTYLDGSSVEQPFVASERNGAWQPAIEVPGIGALSTGGGAALTSVSCASAGNCSAGGYYTDTSGHGHAFAVSQVRGTWGKAREVSDVATPGPFSFADVTSVSCASAGSCSAGGNYGQKAPHPKAFVVSQVRGTWGKAREVAATLNTGGPAEINSVSCGSAGNCMAAGFYSDRSGHVHAFVVSERNGIWRRAIEVPGIRALSKGRDAGAASVSCASAGHCAVGGSYTDSARNMQAFVASQT